MRVAKLVSPPSSSMLNNAKVPTYEKVRTTHHDGSPPERFTLSLTFDVPKSKIHAVLVN